MEIYAMFVRVKIGGWLSPWRFEGQVTSMQEVNKIEEQVTAENGPDSFFWVKLPE